MALTLNKIEQKRILKTTINNLRLNKCSYICIAVNNSIVMHFVEIMEITKISGISIELIPGLDDFIFKEGKALNKSYMPGDPWDILEIARILNLNSYAMHMIRKHIAKYKVNKLIQFYKNNYGEDIRSIS